MPTKVEYSEEKELTEFFAEIMKLPDFADLVEDEVAILPCFCIRTNDDGENVDYKWPPVKAKKVDEAMRIFMPEKPHYVLIVDYTYWKDVQPAQCEAAIHEALCSINVTKTDAGDLKLKTVPPEIVTYARTLKRYGPYRQTLQDAADFFTVRDGMRKNTERLLPNMDDTEDSEEPEEKPEEKPARPVNKQAGRLRTSLKPKPKIEPDTEVNGEE